MGHGKKYITKYDDFSSDDRAAIHDIRSNPALKPINLPTVAEQQTITLDAGHGPYEVLFAKFTSPHRYHNHHHHHHDSRIVRDHGASVNHIYESDINLAVTLKLGAKLKDKGFNVLFTRSSENDVVESRFAARRDLGGATKIMHVSIHCDSCPSHKAMGINAYCHRKVSRHSLSYDFAEALADKKPKRLERNHEAPLNDRDLHKISTALMELGNLQNPRELKLLSSDSGQEKIAEILAERIVAYYEKRLAAKHGALVPRPEQKPKFDYAHHEIEQPYLPFVATTDKPPRQR